MSARGLEHSEGSPGRQVIPVDDRNLGFSPYTWKIDREGLEATAEACMPGAYLRATFSGSNRIGVIIDGPAESSCERGELPLIEASVDQRPFIVERVEAAGGRYVLDLAAELDPGVEHTLDLCFRAGTLNRRWTSPAPRLRVGGLRLAAGGRLGPAPRRPKLAIGWGDSITEGVGVDARFVSWSELDPNRARATWFPIVASALDAEYGQLGSGGQALGTTVPGGLPPLSHSWPYFDDSERSRLVAGLLDPEPDYIFCNHGTNDRADPTTHYERWLAGVRLAAPAARIFLVVPINGFWRREITAVAANRRAAGDRRVHALDCPTLQTTAPAGGRPTSMAFDGAHPTALGQALFGAAVAAQAASAIASDRWSEL